ncbi:MAG: hypothetical protein ACK5LZ_02115 [Anaerorhabdus sp.]
MKKILVDKRLNLHIQKCEKSIDKYVEEIKTLKGFLDEIEGYEATGAYVENVKEFASQGYEYLQAEISYYKEYIVLTKKIIGKYVEIDEEMSSEIGGLSEK